MGYIVQQYAAGDAGLAFTGDRNSIWHKLGNAVDPTASPADIAKAARLDFTVAKAPASALIDGQHVETDRHFLYRRDTGKVLSPVVVSDMYSLANIQPIDFLEYCQRFASVDPSLKFSAAGMLDGGARIWVTASHGDITVAGERHLVYLLLTTTYDASACSEASISIVRAICDNTLTAAMQDGATRIKVRHNSTFLPGEVAGRLAKLAQATTRFKAIGDALAGYELSKEQVSAFLRGALDIEASAKIEDVSTRKQNQLHALHAAYKQSVTEGAPKQSAWACLQALTRYVDHDRSTRNTQGDEAEKRFQSAQWGTGDAMKQSGMEVLTGLLKAANKMPVLA